MKKSIIKKIAVSALALTMTIGSLNIVSAAAPHAANGANIVKSGTWTSFSVCDGHHGKPETAWERDLKLVPVYAEDDVDKQEIIRYQTYGQDYATEGWLTAPAPTPSSFNFFVKNTGWDGEYTESGTLERDNPWGLRVAMDMGRNITEKNREYTVSFKIKSGLIAKGKTDPKTGVTPPDITTKQIQFSPVTPNPTGEGGTPFEMYDTKGMTEEGYIVLDSSKTDNDGWVEVSGKFKVPNKVSFSAGKFGMQFIMGGYIMTRPEEIALSGLVEVKDLKVIAGTQYTVTFANGSTKYTQYVNYGEAPTIETFEKKGYTLSGFKASDGKVYTAANISSFKVKKNETLNAQWKKVAKPAKAKISVKGGKKKATVTVKQTKNANGYVVYYSQKKNMKSAKHKNLNAPSGKVTVKGKRGKYIYVKVKAFSLDSTGKKYYGKLSARKKAFVR